MSNKFPAIVGADAEMLVDGKWIKGKIVEGYRFDDGVVTIEDENGKWYWCGSARTDCYRQINAEDPDIADALSETYDKGQEDYKQKIGKMITEIENINPFDYGYSRYEASRVAREVKSDILEIIHKYYG